MDCVLQLWISITMIVYCGKLLTAAVFIHFFQILIVRRQHWNYFVTSHFAESAVLPLCWNHQWQSDYTRAKDSYTLTTENAFLFATTKNPSILDCVSLVKKRRSCQWSRSAKFLHSEERLISDCSPVYPIVQILSNLNFL